MNAFVVVTVTTTLVQHRLQDSPLLPKLGRHVCWQSDNAISGHEMHARKVLGARNMQMYYYYYTLSVVLYKPTYLCVCVRTVMDQ